MMLLANLLIPPPPFCPVLASAMEPLWSLPAPTFHSLLDVAANLKIKFIIWDWPSWQRTVASFVSFVLFPALLLSLVPLLSPHNIHSLQIQLVSKCWNVSSWCPRPPQLSWLVSFCFYKYYSSYSRASPRFLSKPSSAITSQLLENVSVLCKFWTFVKRNKTKLKFRQHITKCIHKSIYFLCVLSNIFLQIIISSF